MKTFQQKWYEAVTHKNTILCAGLDPAEASQRLKNTLPEGSDKLDWCLGFVESIAPYAAAVKINRNYIKDFSREDTQTLVEKIHALGMVAIDDTKLADIGSTNQSGFYHAAQEGFDAVTYAPLPGNIQEAVEQAHGQGLGLIVLTILSNPEYATLKAALVNDKPMYHFIAEQVKEYEADSIVIGAPSETNHIRIEEIQQVSRLIDPKTLILVPGVGTQGGELKSLVTVFGDRVIANVGRAIMFAEHPATAARTFQELFNDLRLRQAA